MRITVPLTADVDVDAYARHHGLTDAQAVREHLRLTARRAVQDMDPDITEARLTLPSRYAANPFG